MNDERALIVKQLAGVWHLVSSEFRTSSGNFGSSMVLDSLSSSSGNSTRNTVENSDIPRRISQPWSFPQITARIKTTCSYRLKKRRF